MNVESTTEPTTELEETKQQSKLQECVAQKIPKVIEDHPEMERDQAVAVAFSMCREKLGIEKADILRIIENENIFDIKLFRLLETGQIFNIKLQKQLITKIKSKMDKNDLIEYGLRLRQEGKTAAQTAEYLPYSESWVKKHINPEFKKVTQQEQQKLLKSQFSPMKLQEIMAQFQILDIKKEQRRFTAYASSEQIDAQGEILGIKGLMKNMPIFMRRGGTILFSHTNRPVGKALEWEERNILVNNKSIPAILVDVEVFHDYIGDDLAWACVLHAQENDLPILSFGATPTSPPEKICDEVKCVRKYNDTQPYEISIVNVLQGIIGANPGAKIVSLGPMTNTEPPELPPMMGGKLAKAQEDGLFENDLAILNYALETCDLCKAQYAKMIQDGVSDQEAQKLLLHELKKKMSGVLEETDELKKEGDQMAPAVGGMNELMTALQRIERMLTSLLPQKVPSNEGKATEEPVKPMMQPDNLKALIAEEVEKSIAAMSSDKLIALIKQKGGDVISTPVPDAGNITRPEVPDVQKQTSPDNKDLSDAELYDMFSSPIGAQEYMGRIQHKKK